MATDSTEEVKTIRWPQFLSSLRRHFAILRQSAEGIHEPFVFFALDATREVLGPLTVITLAKWETRTYDRECRNKLNKRITCAFQFLSTDNNHENYFGIFFGNKIGVLPRDCHQLLCSEVEALTLTHQICYPELAFGESPLQLTPALGQDRTQVLHDVRSFAKKYWKKYWDPISRCTKAYKALETGDKYNGVYTLEWPTPNVIIGLYDTVTGEMGGFFIGIWAAAIPKEANVKLASKYVSSCCAFLHISFVFIGEKYRGNNAGSMMMELVINHFRQSNPNLYMLVHLVSDPRAEQFWQEKMCFEVLQAPSKNSYAVMTRFDPPWDPESQPFGVSKSVRIILLDDEHSSRREQLQAMRIIASFLEHHTGGGDEGYPGGGEEGDAATEAPGAS